MTYTVKQLADLAGVSVRTLHHYDAIGLLKPERVADNGYRQYGLDHVALLQQIMFFRELDFELEQIKRIIYSPSYVAESALEDHKQLLQMERKRLNNLIKTIDTTLDTMQQQQQHEELADQFEAFEKKNITEYKEELAQKYDPELIQQSQQRVAKWTRQQKAEVLAEGKAIVQAIADAMSTGSDSQVVQQQIALYHQHMNRFYDCSLEIFRGLGEMYIQDPRFTQYYEDVAPGLAQFMHDAMQHYAETHS